jgi:hypothetical protein
VPAPRAGAATEEGGALKQRLRGLPEGERERVVLEVVRGEVAAVLGFKSPTGIGPDQPLQEGGMDSLMAVELRKRLGALAGVKLRATVVFDHPTPRALGRMLLQHLAPDKEAAAPAPPPEPSLDLDRVIAALRAASPDELRALKLTGPLGELVQRAGPRVEEPKPTRSALETSNMDELFSLIDEELGSGG